MPKDGRLWAGSSTREAQQAGRGAGVSARAGAALERRAHTSGTGPPWSEPERIQDGETNYGMIGVRAVLLIPCPVPVYALWSVWERGALAICVVSLFLNATADAHM